MLSKLIRFAYRLRSPGKELDSRLTGPVIIGLATPFFTRLVRGFFRQLLVFRRPAYLLIGSSVRIGGWRWLQIGRWSQIGDYTQISAIGQTGIILGERVTIGPFCRLFVTSSPQHFGKGITLGNRVAIGDFSHIGGAGGVSIAENTIIGPYFSCHPENHVFSDTNIPIREQSVTQKGIIIKDDCWIGAKVTVLDGVTIGRGCVIAAGAVVTRSVPDFSIVAGVPARVVRSRLAEDDSLGSDTVA